MNDIQEIIAGRIVKLSKKRKLARKSLDYKSVNYYNGSIDELRKLTAIVNKERG